MPGSDDRGPQRGASEDHNELEDDPVTDDEQLTMANLKAAYSECNITITGFEAITLKAKPDQADITFEN